MTRFTTAAVLVASIAQWSCGCSKPSASAPDSIQSALPSRTSEITEAYPTPPPEPTGGPVAIYSNTTHVEALAGAGHSLWVATQGGLEEYDLTKRSRVALYTTRAGLPTLAIEGVSIGARGLPVVTTARHRCALHDRTRRFACVSSEQAAAEPPSESTERIEGAAVTAHYRSADGRECIGTAGLGVWERHAGQLQRLTPTEQVVSNHVVAIAEWKGSVYVASFDHGLGRFNQGRFAALPLEAHLLNDVIATPSALFVAASDGLYKSVDGERFARETRVTERFISDLAYDARSDTLYATATSSLWELALGTPARPTRATYLPGGSRSLQAVDISSEGTLFLATEDRGVLRRDGKRRFTSFDRLAGYPSSWATDVLALDGTSALFGSLHHGVFAVGGASQKPIASPSPWILFLGRDSTQSGRLLVGTQGGATLIEGDTSRKLEGLPNPCVHAMARLSSGLWVGTEGGLAQYRQ